MYFNADTQADILARFHFALNRKGYLFLGKAEMLLTHTNLFTPVNLNHRLFQTVPGAIADARVRLRATRAPDQPTLQRDTRPENSLEAAALETAPEAAILLDGNRNLAAANRRARSLFRLDAPDLGKPFQDLELSYRPVELRSVIDKVAHQHQATTVDDVRWEPPEGEAKVFTVYVAPLLQGDGTVRGTLIVFRDETECARLEKDLQQSRADLQAAYEELQSTNEELETTNEELQSSNEELETTNEELQASNEELETTNEELQATNEELKTMNDQLRQRTDELDNANAFLESVLDGLQTGVVVVDEAMEIESWNAQAAELWGLREDEVVGQHLMNLDIGLELEILHKALRRVLSGEVACEQKTPWTPSTAGDRPSSAASASRPGPTRRTTSAAPSP
jgi:two-component system CheB/CheR fusion protein